MSRLRSTKNSVAMRFYGEAMRLGEIAISLDRKKELKRSIDAYAKSVEYFLAGLRRDRDVARVRQSERQISLSLLLF